MALRSWRWTETLRRRTRSSNKSFILRTRAAQRRTNPSPGTETSSGARLPGPLRESALAACKDTSQHSTRVSRNQRLNSNSLQREKL